MTLEARGVRFGYDGSAPLFDDWDLTVADGEVIAITGPSGRGKSTLLYLLGLMLRLDSGQILLDGQGISLKSDAERASIRAHRFGFVFQDSALDATRTVLDNVLETSVYRGEPRSERMPRALELLEQMGVAGRADVRPGQVSGGQAQRISLCRALLHSPKVLLADEPTGNLDKDSAAVVLDSFKTHARTGASVVVVTHDASVAASCDRVVAL